MLPYAHYALIYLDSSGKLRSQESSSIQDQQSTLFSPEVQQRFLDILGPKIGYHRPSIMMMGRCMHLRFFDFMLALAYADTIVLSKDDRRWSALRNDSMNPWQDPLKRQRSHSRDDTMYDGNFSSSESVEDFAYSPMDTIELEIGDTEKVIAYYEAALRRFQQLNCRNIAKSFIKAIEPRKQVKHPYNGGRSGDPEATKPAWWPASVMHKEPDHLKMECKYLFPNRKSC